MGDDVTGPASIAAAGINDAAGHFLSGWHERARDGRVAIPYRASAAQGTVRIARVPGATRLHVLLSAPVSVAGRALGGAIFIEDTRHDLRLEVDAWVLRTYPLPSSLLDSLTIRFSADTPVIPDVYLRNGDGRALGWYVSMVWQS